MQDRGLRRTSPDKPGRQRKIESEKWRLLGIALLVAGAFILGVLAHSEALKVQSEMEDARIEIKGTERQAPRPDDQASARLTVCCVVESAVLSTFFLLAGSIML